MSEVTFEGSHDLCLKLVEAAKRIPGLKMRSTNTAGKIALSADGNEPGQKMTEERRRELHASIDLEPLPRK
jgi:hypothetical protein